MASDPSSTRQTTDSEEPLEAPPVAKPVEGNSNGAEPVAEPVVESGTDPVAPPEGAVVNFASLPQTDSSAPVPPPPPVPEEEPPVAEEIVPEVELIPPPIPEAQSTDIPLAAPVQQAEPPSELTVEEEVAEEVSPPEAPPASVEPVTLECPICSDAYQSNEESCSSCGYVFPPDMGSSAAAPSPESAAVPSGLPVNPAPSGSAMTNSGTPQKVLKNRYQIFGLLTERLGISRYQGRDTGIAGTDSDPILVVAQKISSAPSATEAANVSVESEDDDEDVEEILPSFDEPAARMMGPATEILPSLPKWPNVAWEKALLEGDDPSLPRVIDSFIEQDVDYLILEVPQGHSLWLLWDDQEVTWSKRFDWLAQVATILENLKNLHTMPETLTPDKFVVDQQGQVRLVDTSDLLPLPVPENVPLLGTHYTAPELVSSSDKPADARALLYSFGAMIQSLYIGRHLNDIDFETTGQPKPFIPLFPEVHPMLGRLMSKTFVRSVDARLPTDEASREDPTGLAELIRMLRTCGRVMDNVRLEVAAWTTTGMVRTGNEDAFSLLHHSESRQEDFSDCALVLLADGMGGYEAGEVAASMALQELRKFALQHPPFRALFSATGFTSDTPNPEGNDPISLDVPATLERFKQALVDTNKAVFTASKANPSRRGMGCTAELVYVDGRNLIVGHVGDSRTYHFSEGHLAQVTRDQTLVNRLVELGQLTEEEAEDHPRKNELQQAIGGQPTVDPEVYHVPLRPGDVVLVCSDGLVNHVNNATLREFLLEESFSAEIAARRLVNLTNIHGATDNTTVVVIRAS